MAFLLPAKLAGPITDREAVADALYRLTLGFDANDEAILVSALADDVTVEIAGIVTKGVSEFKTEIFGRTSKLDTTHCLSNVRVSLESATTAKATAFATAQHLRPGKNLEPGAPKYMSGVMYLFELVKDGDLWKIKDWKTNIRWLDGDPTVMAT